MQFSIGIVTYQDAKALSRALESVGNLSDDIIVVYDGEPDAETVQVVKMYNARLIIEEHLGGSDPHRITIFKEAKYDWVFMLDSDECISTGLSGALLGLTEGALAPYDAVSVLWPLTKNGKVVTHHNTRPVLFRKQNVWMADMHNFGARPVGKTLHIPAVLEHYYTQEKVGLGLVFGALGRRVERDAKSFARTKEQVRCWNAHLVPQKFWQDFNALQAGGWCYAVMRGAKHFLGSYKNMWKDGWYGLVVSLQLALYQYKLARRICQIMRTKKLP